MKSICRKVSLATSIKYVMVCRLYEKAEKRGEVVDEDLPFLNRTKTVAFLRQPARDKHI